MKRALKLFGLYLAFVLAMLALAIVTGCGDNLSPPAPDAPVDASLPSCAELGCPDLPLSDRVCAETGVCACHAGLPRSSPPVPCDPR